MEPVSSSSKPTVGLVSWQIDEDGIDIRPGDFVSWVVLVVPPRYFRFSTEQRPVDHLFDTSGLTQSSEVGGQFRYVRIEGIVESVEAANRRELVAKGAALTRSVQSTARADAISSDGAIVTFADAAVKPSTAEADSGEVEVRRA